MVLSYFFVVWVMMYDELGLVTPDLAMRSTEVVAGRFLAISTGKNLPVLESRPTVKVLAVLVFATILNPQFLGAIV